MLLLLSPAKSLDYESPLPKGLPHTLPVFTKEPLALIKELRKQSPQQLSELMGISDNKRPLRPNPNRCVCPANALPWW